MISDDIIWFPPGFVTGRLGAQPAYRVAAAGFKLRSRSGSSTSWGARPLEEKRIEVSPDTDPRGIDLKFPIVHRIVISTSTWGCVSHGAAAATAKATKHARKAPMGTMAAPRTAGPLGLKLGSMVQTTGGTARSKARGQGPPGTPRTRVRVRVRVCTAPCMSNPISAAAVRRRPAGPGSGELSPRPGGLQMQCSAAVWELRHWWALPA
eukprot:SAG22_NODE_115_length_19315_cov_10.458368_1_plen_208_part_00